MRARLGTSLQAVLHLAGVRLKGDPDQAPKPVVAVVHCGDMEDYARHFNEGYAQAVEHFSELLTEVRSDLRSRARAKDVLGWLDDAVKAMGGVR